MVKYEAGFIEKNKSKLLLLLLGLISCLYLVFCAVNISIAATLLLACIVFYVLYKNIDLGFISYIIVLTFSYVPLSSSLPLGITAVKLQLIIFATFFILFILYKKLYKISIVFNVFFSIIMILYIIAWVRSTDYALLTFTDNLAGKLSIYRYFIDYVSWTFTAFIPLIVIAYFYGDKKGINIVLKTLAISVVLFGAYLIYIYIFKVNNRSDFEAIRTEFANLSGLHGNDIANYFILAFPVILAWALYKKNFAAFFTLFIIVIGTAISFSRTAYFVILFGFFLFLFLSKKSKWIPIIALILGISLYLVLPSMVIDRAETGIGTSNYDELSAGRIDYVWGPVIKELASKPQVVLFGSGRYGFTNTDAWKQGRVSSYSHAHNMYLDCILDMGVIGLGVFLAFFITVILYFRKVSKKYMKTFPYYANLLIGCEVSIICYLISGLSGRTVFPTVANVYLWVIIGLGIAITGYVKGCEDIND